jgi:TonB family protein
MDSPRRESPGLLQGVAAHDLRRQGVRQIKIRNDGTTSLFVDAIGTVNDSGAATKARSATGRGEPAVQSAGAASAAPTRDLGPQPPVPLRAPLAAEPATSSLETGATPTTIASPPQATLPNAESPPFVESAPGRRVDPRAVAAAEPFDRAAASVAEPRGSLQPPEQIRRVPAKYPKVAEMANVEGTVVIEAVIDEHGRVTKPRVLKSIPLLDAAALEAVRQWEFAPAQRDGVPVTAKLSVAFALR